MSIFKKQKIKEEPEIPKIRAIIDDKLFDSSKAEFLYKYKDKEGTPWYGYQSIMVYIFKTKKNNYFQVLISESDEPKVKEIFRFTFRELLEKRQEIDLYIKYFGPVEEA